MLTSSLCSPNSMWSPCLTWTSALAPDAAEMRLLVSGRIFFRSLSCSLLLPAAREGLDGPSMAPRGGVAQEPQSAFFVLLYPNALAKQKGQLVHRLGVEQDEELHSAR